MRHPSLALATAALLIVVALPLAISLAVFARIERRAQDRADRRARGEVELRVSNPGAARLALYRAGQNQGEAVPVAVESFTSAWLPRRGTSSRRTVRRDACSIPSRSIPSDRAPTATVRSTSW